MLCIQIPHIKSKRNAMLFGLGLALTSTLYIIYYVHKSRSVSQQEKQRCKKLITSDSYLKHMIPHHQVAVDMSKRLLLHTNHSYLMDFCRKLIIDQQYEIVLMTDLLRNKYQHQSCLI